MANDEKDRQQTSPHEYDKSADKHVEKSPSEKQTPQQDSNDEDHG